MAKKKIRLASNLRVGKGETIPAGEVAEVEESLLEEFPLLDATHDANIAAAAAREKRQETIERKRAEARALSEGGPAAKEARPKKG